MKLGVLIEETWDFFKDLYADWTEKYETCLFARREIKSPFFTNRINRFLLRRDLSDFMHRNDILFFEWASDLLAVATHLPKTSPIITRLHRYEMYEHLNKIDWNYVDRIILVSSAKQQEFIQRLPSQASKTIVINPTIKMSRYKYQPRVFRGNIGILCHLTPRKRVYDLILTFYELLQKNGNFHLHIAGDEHPFFEDYSTAMLDIVERLGIQEKVTFHGFMPNPSDWFSGIDIFVSNSYSEGLQVAPMEAMASGCYCLVHYWRGAEELVTTENLFFTGAQLQKKILEYSELSDSERRAKQEQMRAIACDRFDVEKSKQVFRSLLEDVHQTSRFRRS